MINDIALELFFLSFPPAPRWREKFRYTFGCRPNNGFSPKTYCVRDIEVTDRRTEHFPFTEIERKSKKNCLNFPATEFFTLRGMNAIEKSILETKQDVCA